ncbi:MAG: methyl-accepting chemotaxis protein [Ktedonobacteraceae bacterium]
MFNLKWLSNTPIFRRLFLAFALAAVVPGIIIAVLGITYINTLTARGQAEQTNNAAMKLATSQLAVLQHMNADLTAFHATALANKSVHGQNDPTMASMVQNLNNEIITLQGNFTQALGTYQQKYQLATSPDMAQIQSILQSSTSSNQLALQQQQTLRNVSSQQWPQYLATQQQVLLASKSNLSRTVAQQDLLHANALFTPLLASWQQVVDIAQTVSDQIVTIGTAQTDPIMIATLAAILGTMIVVVTIGYIVNLTITRPLRQLATLTRRIAKGETSARAILVGRDEIYMVSDSMNKMLDNIVRLIQETQAQRDNLQGQVEKLVSEVSGVGEGDLRVQAEVTADALGVLADSFNYMVEELGSLVVRVKLVSHEVENSTSAIFERLTQLVETGDIQINQIGGAGVEIERMADSSRQVADRAQNLFTLSRNARQSAQGGREAVQQAVQGIGRIHANVQETAGKVQTLGERSREINNIVGVISDIAHQTNRLALDAAIQAAMAGENGKGFAAVAADIRRLAERAKDQANMITKIVRGVREDIGAAAVSMQDTERETSSGAKLTNEAGVALESIFTSVELQAKEIENINLMATQQLQSSSAVVQIIRAVTNTTQQSTMSTRDASQNMERLARLVEQLRASVEAFKLRENQAYYVPTTNVSPLDNQDNQLTVSSVLRTVTATATGPNAAMVGRRNALPPAHASDPFSFYPITSNQQQNV